MECKIFAQRVAQRCSLQKSFVEVDAKSRGFRGRGFGGLHNFVDVCRFQSGICTYDRDFVHISVKVFVCVHKFIFRKRRYKNHRDSVVFSRS